MRRLAQFCLTLCFLSLAVWADPICPIPSDSRQAIVILSSDWDTTAATMYRFERSSAEAAWKPIGAVVPVNLGRTGFAWGESPLMNRETVAKLSGPHKREGDGKSPAGVFPILKAFGHPKAPAGYKRENLPFLVVSDHQCVDDTKSEYYNSIVKPGDVGGVTWNSAEKMKIGLYKKGLVVGHNCPAVKPGLGSCIFFHLQSEPGAPTSGCTSMADGPLTNLLLWLKKDAKPVVLQLPKAEFDGQADPSWPKLGR